MPEAPSSPENAPHSAPPANWHSLTEAQRRAIHSLLNREHHVRNLNHLSDAHLSRGQRFADGVARTMGSWRFIIIQSVLLAAWVALNAIGWIRHWDPYPFILLNLALSFQAAYSAPIIMMSQNRQAAKDRLAAEHDYRVNMHAELEISEVQRRLDDLAGGQWNDLVALQSRQIELLNRIARLSSDVHRLAKQQSGESAQ